MGAARHLAHIHDVPTPKRRRKRGGGDDDGGYVIPSGSCEACARHWHHKCWGANILDDERPDCPCPCGDASDPARLNQAAWTDLAKHAPGEVWRAARMERMRAEGGFACYLTDEERHRSAIPVWNRER